MPVVWQDTGPVEQLDFFAGPGGRNGAPQPPFRLEKEDTSGTSPKLLVRDARNQQWSVKFGEEARPEVFGSRIAWAMGYIISPSYFVAQGKVINPGVLRRAGKHVHPDGTFENARFQERGGDLKFLPGTSWGWLYNPFVGTHELNGLKITMMLLSNWDNKDGRDAEEGTNTLMFERTVNGQRQYVYMMNDWGQIMGRWGSYFRRTNWNCPEFTADNAQFIKGVNKRGELEWGYRGRHNNSFTSGISREDVRWLLQRLGRVTEAQWRDAFRAAGTPESEAECFTAAIRQRVQRLQEAAR